MADGMEGKAAMRREKLAFDYDAERKKNERIKVQKQLEALDADKDKLHLWGRLRNEGVCMCGACDKRRYWIAMKRVGKKEEEIAQQEEFDKFIQSSFKGEDEDMEYLQQAFEKYGPELLSYVGGPIAVSSCEQCGAVQSKDKCYHCGREPWMRSRTDLKVARRDVKQMTRYLTVGALHAAVLGVKTHVVEKLVGWGAPINMRDDMGCTALHWCSCSGHLNQIKQQTCITIGERLLKDGADVTIEDLNGMTATELTTKPNPTFNAMRMAILKSARKELTEQLLEGCRKGKSEVVMRILKAGADLAIGDWLNDTPFHIVAMYGHMDLMLEMVDIADKEDRLLTMLDAQTVDGLTPADTALKWGYKAVHAKLVSLANNKRVGEVVESLAVGNKIPPELRGTALGIQLERELRKHNAVSARMKRAVGLGKKKPKSKDVTTKEDTEGSVKSAVCVVC
uniref:Ankyrin repeat protein n=1 Tax=Hemiselmis tepida TaxID=464990 RepID=A0A7S0W8C0_9CRYP|mmetsp:Transcript_856/g.2112  ORF Transcript_856/g.2112 Transcript_856/m.2112 type:complete len:452 (+) Transcript_856:24-1379(+)